MPKNSTASSSAPGAALPRVKRAAPTGKRRIGANYPIERLVEIERRLAQFQQRGKIVIECAHEWGCAIDTIDRYIAEVRRRWHEAEAPERAARRAELRKGFEQIVARAYAEGDMKAAASAMREMGKLDGVYMPEEIKHSGDVGVRIDVANPDAVRARIAELQERLAKKGK